MSDYAKFVQTGFPPPEREQTISCTVRYGSRLGLFKAVPPKLLCHSNTSSLSHHRLTPQPDEYIILSHHRPFIAAATVTRNSDSNAR